jgi:hypothetical protein
MQREKWLSTCSCLSPICFRLTSACLQEPFPSQTRHHRTSPSHRTSSRASYPPSDSLQFSVQPSFGRAASAAPDLSSRSPLSSSSPASSLPASGPRRTFRRGALPLGASPTPPVFSSSSSNVYAPSSSPPNSTIRPRQRSSVQVRATATSIMYMRHNCSSLLSLCYHPICIIAHSFFVTHAFLQGWLSPVRPGEHYLATYISTIVKPLPNPCMCCSYHTHFIPQVRECIMGCAGNSSSAIGGPSCKLPCSTAKPVNDCTATRLHQEGNVSCCGDYQRVFFLFARHFLCSCLVVCFIVHPRCSQVHLQPICHAASDEMTVSQANVE